jgi:hypothetical protein
MPDETWRFSGIFAGGFIFNECIVQIKRRFAISPVEHENADTYFTGGICEGGGFVMTGKFVFGQLVIGGMFVTGHEGMAGMSFVWARALTAGRPFVGEVKTG